MSGETEVGVVGAEGGGVDAMEPAVGGTGAGGAPDDGPGGDGAQGACAGGHAPGEAQDGGDGARGAWDDGLIARRVRAADGADAGERRRVFAPRGSSAAERHAEALSVADAARDAGGDAAPVGDGSAEGSPPPGEAGEPVGGLDYGAPRGAYGMDGGASRGAYGMDGGAPRGAHGMDGGAYGGASNRASNRAYNGASNGAYGDAYGASSGARAYREPFGRAPEGARGARTAELRSRLDALRELIALSRARLDGETLAEAGRVLDAAGERYRLSGEHTVVALAGATGSGKSSLFNALVGAGRSQVGARRPTTSEAVACIWPGGPVGADGLLDRLGVPHWRRHLALDCTPELSGLILLDLPDHDSSDTENRAQVDRMLELVDAVIWVVDPEKYADAVLHERYLRPLAGYAEVMFVVLNQVDRLPGDAADQVVDDLRRLLDEDGLALGEHGEPGAAVLALSAATGSGVAELRDALGQFVAERGAADRRLAADVDAAAERLRPVYVARARVALTERARAEFEDRLADAVGAVATGCAVERDWLRHAERACGSPWSRLRMRRRTAERERSATTAHASPAVAGPRQPGTAGAAGTRPADGRAAARPVVEQAVRAVAGEAAHGLPAPWALAVREAAARGAQGLPEALDKVTADTEQSLRGGPAGRPRWWTVAAALQGLLFVLQVVGLLSLLGVVTGVVDPAAWFSALLPAVTGSLGCPVLAWLCRAAARGPARRYGQEAERRLRNAAAGCGRARVLEPVAAELLRYREVREQYAVASGA
ncbi:GTPase [Streptomyces sp. NPDC048650]|uniref:GTPase n=1 Tax=unclassified Streptomyces TaxID=2593676 RepID=UPI00371BEC07